MSGLVKMLLVVFGVGSVACSTYFLEQVIRSDRSFQVTSAPDDEEAESGEAEDGEEGAKAKGGEHEAKAEGEHGGGEHGEGGEGEGARKPAAATIPGAPVIVSLEQTFANVMDGDSRTHSLMMKLDVELFDENGRTLVDQRDGVLKSTIIEAARRQSYENLNTIGGKAYFKEQLVARMNEALQKPIVREIHFNTFFMQ